MSENKNDKDDRRYRADIGLGDAAFFFAVTILFIMFWGDPDLSDALIHNLCPDCVPSEAVTK